MSNARDALAERLCRGDGMHWLPEPPDQVCVDYRKRADELIEALYAAGFEVALSDQLEQASQLLVDSRSIATAWDYAPVGPECTMEMAAHADDVTAFLRIDWQGAVTPEAREGED